MNRFDEMLEIIIKDGIQGAKEDYKADNQKEQLEGAIDGFNACRNLEVEGLMDLYKTSNQYLLKAHDENSEKYWYFRCYQAEVEWVINVMSALFVLNNEELKLVGHLPTVAGMSKAMHVMMVLERKK